MKAWMSVSCQISFTSVVYRDGSQCYVDAITGQARRCTGQRVQVYNIFLVMFVGMNPSKYPVPQL